MSKFNPNEVTFEEGAKRVQAFLKEVCVDTSEQIMTSRDEIAVKLQRAMTVRNIPDGFEKWQLPFVMEPTQLFITRALPGAKANRHAHEEGDGIRFIVQGSIVYRGQELSAGDWMFIPAGKDYEFEAGPHGALMCYCYACCCGGKTEVFDPSIVMSN